MTTQMIQVDLDQRALVERGRRQGLNLRDIDNGYLVHGALDATFGAGVVRPFCIAGQHGRRVRVLGYVDGGADLRGHADAFADPSDHAAWDWSSLATKPMPNSWEPGRRLGFEVTVCPVIRSSGGAMYAKGAEVDAFLAECTRVGPEVAVERAQVYRDWLGQRLQRGGATLTTCELSRFELAKVLRRTQGDRRRSTVRQRPVATMSGQLEVSEGDAFSRLIASGVGRHRAFGFGMLLLRAPT